MQIPTSTTHLVNHYVCVIFGFIGLIFEVLLVLLMLYRVSHHLQHDVEQTHVMYTKLMVALLAFSCI